MRLAGVLAHNLFPLVGNGKAKRLDAVFWSSVLVSTCLLTWSVLSTIIDRVDEDLLSLARLLPPTYWVGLALLLASTFIWYFGGETKAFHFLLVGLWMGYVFLGPELMELHPRGYPSYGHEWGIAHVLANREREFLYFPWLGFHYTFAMLTELTNIIYLGMIRVGLLSLYVALAAGLIVFFRRVLPDKKSTLLATLAYLAVAAVPGGVGFTPHQMGFILMLFGLSLLASPTVSPVVNRLVLVGLFSGLVITHGLTAVVVVYITTMVAMLQWKRSAVGRWSRSAPSLALLFGTLFFVWLLYSSDYWFPKAVRAFRDTVLREPLAFLSPFSHITPARGGRADVSMLTFAFLAVLLAWLVSVVARRGFWSGLSRDRLFPLLVVSGLPLLITSTGNFTYEGLLRTFFFAGPFMAWFLAGESAGKGTSVVFLVLLLGLGFVLLYSRDFEELPTSQQFAGANFLVEAARPDASLIQGDCMPPQQLANAVEGPIIACPILEPGGTTLVPDAGSFKFVALSEFGQRTATFAFGNRWWDDLRNSVRTEGMARIYSNGRYDVFARLALPDERSQQEVPAPSATGQAGP